MSAPTDRSYVEFGGRGFWAEEEYLSHWLHLLAKELRNRPVPPKEVAEAALSWDHRSRFRPPESGLERLEYDAYWVGLDRFLRSEDAIQLVLTFSRTVLDRVAKSEALLQRSNLLPPDLGPQEQKDMAQLWRGTAEVGEMFVGLLTGNRVGNAGSTL